MRRNVRIIVGVVLLFIVAAGSAGYYTLRASDPSGLTTLSGTIEATQINLSTRVGGQVRGVRVSEGDAVRVGQDLVDIYSPSGHVYEKITSPMDGVVLERLVEPAELAAANTTVMVVASLDTPTLTVYVPENRYGEISLGQTFPVTVDSFPGDTFSGTVTYISDKAEFTPRNVQTVESRETTVYAVKLNLVQSGDKLKPGMPADVHFQPGR